MSDIVDDLNHYIRAGFDPHGVMKDARAEIERLQWLASEQAKDIVMLGQLAGQSAAHEARIAALEAAVRAMESAFVLLTKTMQGSEIGIPLDVGLIIVNAREVARAALQKG